MYVKVRLRLKTGSLTTLRVELPKDLRDYNQDTIDDVVSDSLDDNKVRHKWFRVENPEIKTT